MNHEMLIAQINNFIDESLLPLICDSKNIALLDHPNHPNVGDSAIWLGEQKFLKKHNIKTAYKCDFNVYDEGALRKAIGSNIILIHGGGNFGDIYKHHHDFRLKIISTFTQHKIIQMPQSIHFSSPEKIAETAEIIARHNDFHLLCRDQYSYELSQKHFDCNVYLCPDMAFYIGPVTCPSHPTHTVGFLSRTDSEAIKNKEQPDLSDYFTFDWLEDDNSLTIKLNSLMTKQYIRRPSALKYFHKAIESTYDKSALQRFQRGIRQLCESDIILTNRLHGHILCLLLGKKHYFLDNNYGKLSRFYNLWTKESDITTYCSDIKEAIKRLANMSPSGSDK